MATASEVNHIQAAVQKLDQEIEILQKERALLLGKLNDMVSSPRKLPPEVLSEMFRLAACVPNVRESQLYVVDLRALLKIGSICAHWRRVAWSTPHLWTTSLIPENPIIIPPHLASLVVANAQRNPISLRVDLGNLPPETVSILFQHNRAEVGALRIYMPIVDETANVWDELSSYFMVHSDWSNLNELWLSAEMQPPHGLLIHPPDSLDFTTSGRGIIPWHIPLHQLTILRLFRIPADQCLFLLLHCPNLEEYHCLFPEGSSGFHEPSTLLPPSQRPKSLLNIRTIRWKVHDHEWSEFFSSGFRFPNLKRLHWGVHHSFVAGQTPQKLVPAPWEGLKHSLSRLEVLDWEVSCTSINLYFPPGAPFSSIRQLYVHAPTMASILSWLEGLTIGGNDSEDRFPALSTLHLDIRHMDLGGSRVFNAVQKFLDSRRNGPRDLSPEVYWRNHTCLQRFILETTQTPLHVVQKEIDTLRSFVAGGLIFELVIPNEEGGYELRSTIL
ncbi:hypothetical protein AN958_07381 [Leucoagaricus sp. SymC.cos]|nr:hypothetical protein AN958_07381 [Leucoagaricus sp. SymC.cos]